MEEIFKKEEEVLNNYPKECLKNYYSNKQDVQIIFKDNILDADSILGQYISSTNTIELVDEIAIYHELSHMAFNDRSKYKQPIIGFDNLYYENGVSIYSIKDGKECYLHQGINEGFAEYLSRKNNKINGQPINYYFVNFLISIYGEDILKYPLTNDPIGFLLDQKFDNINSFVNNLDRLNKYFSIILFSYKIEKQNLKEQVNIEKIRNDFLLIYNGFIIETFDSIINEYKKYSDRLIDKEQLLNQINDFNNYDLFNSFDNKKYNVKKYISSYK